jgi:hypothetical protein
MRKKMQIDWSPRSQTSNPRLRSPARAGTLDYGKRCTMGERRTGSRVERIVVKGMSGTRKELRNDID